MTGKNSQKDMTRLGVDIGGTFTDVVLETAGGLYSAKALTTYGAPENAIIDGLINVCGQAHIQPSEIDQIIHGTTLATNALIERKGAKTALITTKGFRDVIEMRTESRFEQYDLNLQLPEPLLARQHRLTVKERMDAGGKALIALDMDSVVQASAHIKQGGYESVAVGLLHSYANPAHEETVRDYLLQHIPGLMVSISSEVSPQMREYERFNTVVANAYVQPLMKSYLSRLSGRLASKGVICPVFLMHSGGGIMSLADAAEFPVRLVESGPAGGAVFAAHIAARYNVARALSFDMGGTTAKICLIKDQSPKTSRVFEVARSYRFKKGSGMPISIPVIDMVEIGAGGGSLASIDAMQQIRVGPHSAGSEPGPACYGRGGTRPAVTDADLLLGKLDPSNFAGGSISLNEAAAAEAVSTEIGAPLQMQTRMAAFGIAEIVDENMASAARMHAVENGEDLGEYTMIAFGGAAPLHAGRLAEKLGVRQIIVPPGAGVGSAIGFLRAPFSFQASRSQFMRLSEFEPATSKQIFAELATEATGFVQSCDDKAKIETNYSVYMRYAGQGWEIPVPLTAAGADNPDPTVFQKLYTDEYAALFGRPIEGMEIEITSWSVNASTPPVRPEPLKRSCAAAKARPYGTRALFDPALVEMQSASLFHRSAFKTGDAAAGPAILAERETTIIVPSGWRAICQSDGSILIGKGGPK